MKYITLLVTLLLFGYSKAQSVDAQCTGGDPKKCAQGHTEEDKHDHAEDEKEHHDDQEDHKHAENEKHDEKEDHGHEEREEHEESTQVGPDKGILEANEKSGFKLSPEATKNFNLKFQVYNGGQVSLPMDAVLQTTEEKNIYRVRDGFIKRTDIEIISKSKSSLTFMSSDLKVGDQIVIAGLGFLRMAELAAFGGAPEGHSH